MIRSVKRPGLAGTLAAHTSCFNGGPSQLENQRATGNLRMAGHFSKNMNRIAAQRQLGRKIRTMRQSRGLTQEAFARMCGITAGRMWKLENGRVNATLATLIRISNQLETQPAELLRGIH